MEGFNDVFNWFAGGSLSLLAVEFPSAACAFAAAAASPGVVVVVVVA